MSLELAHTTAIVHSVYEKGPLENELNDNGIQVVYFSEVVPKNFLKILNFYKSEGAILHNVRIEDEARIQETLSTKTILLIMFIGATDSHREMYNRLEVAGCIITPRHVNNETIIKKYIAELRSNK